ncbi:MAG: DMT family transporter [Aureliella sp.]
MGEAFALAAAAFWAISAFLFRSAGAQVSPLILNAAKGTLAVGVLGVWFLATGTSIPEHTSASAWWWLLLSGVIGIGIGDTAFFSALNRLGEQTTVLVAETFAPPLTALLALLWMGEQLTPQTCFGIFVTLCGVSWVLSERPARPKPAKNTAAPEHYLLPLSLAILAAACQSIGAVISRDILLESGMGPAESSFIRMAGGLAMLAIVIPVSSRLSRPRPKANNQPKTRWTKRTILYVLLATLLGTLLGIVCQQASLKYTSAGISQTLIATSVLFVLPISLIRGHRPSRRSIIGSLVGVIGVAVICWQPAT